MRLGGSVTVQDVGEAVRLMKVAMQQSSIDPRTGQIDMVSRGGGCGPPALGGCHGSEHGSFEACGWEHWRRTVLQTFKAVIARLLLGREVNPSGLNLCSSSSLLGPAGRDSDGRVCCGPHHEGTAGGRAAQLAGEKGAHGPSEAMETSAVP